MIYLNNSATSYPKPKNVIDSILNSLNKPYYGNGRGVSDNDFDYILETRKNLSKILKIKNHNRIIFTSGSTESLNTVIKGIDYINKHIIITETEHNSVIRPLKMLEKEGLIELSILKSDNFGFIEPQSIYNEIRDNTILLIVNHCSNVNGVLQDLKEISKIKNQYGIKLLVDASQSAGIIDINCDELEIDFLAFTGHKNLYGLQGIGGLYISENSYIKPLKYGGTGTKSNYLYQPESLPDYYESGTQNIIGIISLFEGTNFILNEGIDKIKLKKEEFVKLMINELSDNDKVKIYNHPENSSYSNFCFNIGEMTPEEVGFILDSSYGIKVRSGIHCAPLMMRPLGVEPWGTVRASPSYFNTYEEIKIFIEAVKNISKFNF